MPKDVYSVITLVEGIVEDVVLFLSEAEADDCRTSKLLARAIEEGALTPETIAAMSERARDEFLDDYLCDHPEDWDITIWRSPLGPSA